MPKYLQVVIFLVGVVGFFVMGYGLWLIHPPVAFMSCGATAAWWSWYVTIGVHLHAAPSKENP